MQEQIYTILFCLLSNATDYNIETIFKIYHSLFIGGSAVSLEMFSNSVGIDPLRITLCSLFFKQSCVNLSSKQEGVKCLSAATNRIVSKFLM